MPTSIATKELWPKEKKSPGYLKRNGFKVIDGMADNAAAFAGTGVGYMPFVAPEIGAGKGLLTALAEHAALIRESFPAAELEAIDGAGHWLHADQPKSFLSAVEIFLTH